MESSGIKSGSQSGFQPVYLQQERGESHMVLRFSNPFGHFTVAPNRPSFRPSTLRIWPTGPTPTKAPAPLGDKKLTILDNRVALSSRQTRLGNLTGPRTS